MFQSLRPSNEPDYVLIHKKALLINSLVIAQMSSTIEDLTDFQAENIGEAFGNFARDKVNQMSTDNINALCTNILDNADNESGLTIVVKQPPDIVRD